MNVHLPQPTQVRDLFSELLDREVGLAPGVPVAPGPAVPASVATYADEDERVSAVISCDLELSARAGAAIGLVPPAGAERAIRSGCLDGELYENLREVLDVAATLFGVAGANHLRLHGLHPAGAELPDDARSRALTLGRRADVELDIAGYGAGRLSVVLIDGVPGSHSA